MAINKLLLGVSIWCIPGKDLQVYKYKRDILIKLIGNAKFCSISMRSTT